jgi:tetratricopeptide (TPR) repeat protein
MIRLLNITSIVIAIALTSCDSKETRLQNFLLKGNASRTEGDASKALYYYMEALKIDPCYVDALNNAGTIHHENRAYAEAIKEYSKAIECKPQFMEARFNRANSYYMSGEAYSALADIEFIIKAKPDTAAVYFVKGLVQMKQRDFPSSLDAFQKALDLRFPNEVECRVNLATVKIFLGKYDEAKAELLQCEKLNDKEPIIFNNLALIAIENKDYDEAFRQVTKALSINPDDPYFINNRGFIYIQQDKLDEAAADIDRSITIDPYNAWAYRNKGILSIARKDYTSAERLLKKAVEIDKNVEDTQYYLGVVYSNTARKNEACAAFKLSNEAGDELVSTEQLRGCK